jgi:ABC-type phosphate transport system substrate-binding protein
MQSDTLDTNIKSNDIVLEFGSPDNSRDDTYLSQVGWEKVVVVVNQENSLSQLSNNELKSIFSGQGSKSENGTDQASQVWTLPEGEPTRVIFDHAAMQTQSLTTESMLAPDPGAMLEAISQNIDAIGYLPGSFLTTNDSSYTSKVKIIQLDPSLEAELRQPVIAITHSEPNGLVRSLLVCLEANSP